jgi:hypothetical protein
MSKRSHRVVCGVTIVKQKRQACAAFLGVLTISINVVSVCCILTTILRVFAPPARYPEPEKAAAATDRRKLFANQLFRENTASVASQSPRELEDSTHEKGRSGGRCGLSETLFRRATV